MGDLKVYFVTPDKDTTKTDGVHDFLEFVKEKGEVSITPLGPFSDDVGTAMSFLRDSLNNADVVVLLPTTIRDANEYLYFVAGIAYGFGVPIVGMGPEFCEFSFLAPAKNGQLFETSNQIHPVSRVFEKGMDNYEVLLKTIVKAANNCVSPKEDDEDFEKPAFHVKIGRTVSEKEYRAKKARK